MTREESKRRAELYSALAEGKTIQAQNPNGGEWFDVKIETSRSICEEFNYRIKPEPQYRPFKSQEECWNEMLKHQPFGWIRNNDTQRLCNIGYIGRNNCGVVIDNSILYFDLAFNTCNFVDGTPFGIKDE